MTGSRLARPRFSAPGLLVWLIKTVLLTITCIIMIYPFVWMISASFKSVSEMYQIPPTIIPLAPTLDNYRVVMEKFGLLANMYKNSLFIATTITLLQIITCSAAGFVFARMRFSGKNLIFNLFMASMMIPGFLTIIPNFIIMRNLHLINNQWSLILLGTFSAFGIFFYRQFFLTLPLELHEAARIDGCNFFQSFLFIHLPLARSVIAVQAILTFNGAWGDFFGPLIFLKSLEKMTLPLGISLIQGVYSQQSPAVLVATLVVAIIPVIIVYMFAREHLIAGIATTGMKS